MTRSAVLCPPLTLDDLIDLHFMLQADELFLQLIATDLPENRPDSGGDAAVALQQAQL